MDERVGIHLALLLVPEKLLCQERIALHIHHHDIAVETPQAATAEIGGAVGADVGFGAHGQVVLLEAQSARKAPERLARLFEHLPHRRGDVIAGVPAVAHEGADVGRRHGGRACSVAYVRHIALALVAAAGHGCGNERACECGGKQSPHAVNISCWGGTTSG